MKNVAILVSIFLSAALAYIISDYYDMTPPLYLFIVLIALALFIQTVIFILQYSDIDENETENIER